MTRYRSEIGWSFGLLYAFLMWRLGWPLTEAVLTGQSVAPGLLIASVVTLGGLAFLAATTSYTITGDALVVRCGLSRTVTALSAIQKIRASRTLLASPALSLNRLEVLASPGPSVVISPVQQSRFVHELMARAPQIQLEGLTNDAAG
ncbi:MAG: PH domain-containing protein [Vicinamibacterales bacterium]